METRKSTRYQAYLKGFWWIVLIFSFCEVLIFDSFIGLKEGFDWSLIDQPKSCLKLLFYITCWTVGYFLLFLKKNPEKQRESKDGIDDNLKRY